MKKIYLPLLILSLNVCISYGQKPVAKFGVLKDTLCSSDCVTFYDSSTNSPTSWLWTFQGGIPSNSTIQNPVCISYLDSGSFNVTLIATNANGSDTLTKTNFITVNPSPPIPCMTESNDTLYSSTDSSYVSYQWFSNDQPISGKTDTFLVITHGGYYYVEVSNRYGCISVGNSCLNGIESFYDERNISLYPDPAATQLTIRSLSFHTNEDVTILVNNVFGEIVQEEKRKWINNISMNINNLPAGIYFLQMKLESGSVVKKFVKE